MLVMHGAQGPSGEKGEQWCSRSYQCSRSYSGAARCYKVLHGGQGATGAGDKGQKGEKGEIGAQGARWCSRSQMEQHGAQGTTRF